MIRSDGRSSQQFRSDTNKASGKPVFKSIGDAYGGYAKGVRNGPAPSRPPRNKKAH